MTTLAGFLLARIADDETPTWTLVPYPCEPGCCAPAGWVGHQCRYCDATPVYGGTIEAITGIAEQHAEMIHQRSRMLAECDAKRRIVEHHGSNGDDDFALCVICTEVGPDAQGWPCQTLRLLALPYADHPDYRPEWKPT
jgi:hypothetical protein